MSKRETFKIPGTNVVLRNVHTKAKCAGERCVIHNQSDHHMKTWPLHWRADRGIFERICSHGIGHPDPDQFDYLRLLGLDEGTHGCDGCCLGGASVLASQEGVDGPSQSSGTALRIPEAIGIP